MMQALKNMVLRALHRNKLNKSARELSILHQTKTMSCSGQMLPAKESYKTAFIIHKISPYSGGLTSILRLGTYLSELGHDIFYLVYEVSDKKRNEKNARIALPSFRGTILERDSFGKLHFDIGIATSWQSCYYLLAYQDFFSYKAYLIQDFEPYFYPVGDHYVLAQNTYRLGYHMISLGKWCKDLIEEKIAGVSVDAVDFPVEIDQYRIEPRTIHIDREVLLAVYLKMESRRAPLLLIEQLKYCRDALSKKGYRVTINIFGPDKYLKFSVGKNLGKLRHAALIALYKKSHFGVLASMTNISLVNYEMIAAGLPVIDQVAGSAATFFSNDEMILAEPHVPGLYHQVWHYVNHPDELNQLLRTAQERLKQRQVSWRNTARQFNDLLLKQAQEKSLKD